MVGVAGDLLIGGAVGLAAGLAVTAYLSQRRRVALRELIRGIEALGEGRTARPVQIRVGGRTGRLTRLFDAVAPRLADRIEQLEGDRQLLRAVLGGMTEAVIAIDGRRRLLFANNAASRLLGLGPEAVGKLVAELIRSPQVQRAIDNTLASSRPHHVEITVPGPEGWPRGQPLVLAVHGTSLPGPPTAGAVLVVHDVTETRRLERVRQDFVANASHELKTPLASIKAFTETLIGGALHDENVNTRFLQRIDEQADRLNQLILDLLSLARLDSGQETFQHSPIELLPVVRRCFEAQRERAEAKNLDYELETVPEAEGSIVTADEEAIRQILDNLIDNAIKYTPDDGRVRVRLRCPASEGADMVLLEVADTGIGIPREDQPRVFERFYRVDRARSRELGGTGLGLSIVKNLVVALGGQIRVESRVGYGSTFTVCLPRTGQSTATPLAESRSVSND